VRHRSSGRTLQQACSGPTPTRVRWLPDSRRLVYFRSQGELVILDVQSGEQRSIPVDLPAPLADQSFAVAPDGSALCFGAERVESNVRLAEREP